MIVSLYSRISQNLLGKQIWKKYVDAALQHW